MRGGAREWQQSSGVYAGAGWLMSHMQSTPNRWRPAKEGSRDRRHESAAERNPRRVTDMPRRFRDGRGVGPVREHSRVEPLSSATLTGPMCRETQGGRQ